MPATNPLVDRCTECGFCEPRCPSRALTLTPRQRIVVRRELARLEAAPDGAGRPRCFQEAWRYLGDETCATDGLCATACPVGIDTGKLVKALRAEARSPSARRLASSLADHYAGAIGSARLALGAASAARAVLGERGLSGLSRGLRAASGRRLPLWNAALPRPAPRHDFRTVPGRGGPALVYLPSCVVRAMGPARGNPDARPEFEAMLSILRKAGCEVRYPRELPSLCCGLTFASKGFPELAARKAAELQAALLEASEDGRLPVLCDTSPCTQQMRVAARPAAARVRAGRAHPRPAPGSAPLRAPGSGGGWPSTSPAARSRWAWASGCARWPRPAPSGWWRRPPGAAASPATGASGHPELNASALRDLRASLPAECSAGYSNSRTCESGSPCTPGSRTSQSCTWSMGAATSPRLTTLYRFRQRHRYRPVPSPFSERLPPGEGERIPVTVTERTVTVTGHGFRQVPPPSPRPPPDRSAP